MIYSALDTIRYLHNQHNQSYICFVYSIPIISSWSYIMENIFITIINRLIILFYIKIDI